MSWRFYQHSHPSRGPSSPLDDYVTIDFDWESANLSGDALATECLRHIMLATTATPTTGGSSGPELGPPSHPVVF